MSGLAGRLNRWWLGVRLPVLDVVVAGCVAVVVTIAIHLANEPTSRPVDIYAYLLGMALGAVLLARRSYPLTVLLVSAGILFVYYTIGYPGINPALPLSIALFGAAAAGRLRWCVPVVSFFALAGVLVRGARLDNPFLPLLYATLQEWALLGVVILLGETIRNRRIRLAEARDRPEQLDREQERDAAQRVAEERLRIARDVHDIVGHSVAAVTIQASVAREIIDDRPAEAKAAPEAVVRSTRTTMADLKATVGLLCSDLADKADWEPLPGLSDLPILVESTMRLGLRTTLVTRGRRVPLSGVVELSAYRIIQESLTNVLRHANACATVVVWHEPIALTIEVTDDGDGTIDAGHPGYGMVGMNERVVALGGRLEFGPRPAGGFRICAKLPVDGHTDVVGVP